MELLYGIMAAIALSMILGFFQNRKKKQSWIGTMTNGNSGDTSLFLGNSIVPGIHTEFTGGQEFKTVIFS